jgi:Druantia protein DruA/DDE_Tnp_1-associated
MPKPRRLPNIDEQSLLRELEVRLILPGERTQWNKLVRQHHYLKNARLVGEQLRYVVTNANGDWLALIGWSAAAMHLKARDQSIEWTDRQREARLHLLAQNSRFVILAQRQQYPNLASRALSLCLKRLSVDWQAQYHHPIVMVETFVDRESYQATAYKASGWQPLGYSSGFKRVAQDFYQRHGRPKELWVQELDRRAWRWLRAKHLPPHLARFEKSTPPVCTLKTQQMPSLLERFEQVSEWRQPIGKRHKLPTVLAIIALACLSGVGQGYRAVSRFAKRLTKLQRRALRCWIHPDTAKLHVPSEAVFQRVLQEVPLDQIERIILQWQNDLLGSVPATDAVVIDGKEVRGGKVMLVNALAQPSQRLLGVEAVDKKTNEIPTARTLIGRLELSGKRVQLDGMHTQHATVHQILYEKGAAYSLILRENQPTLLETAQQLLPADVPPCTGAQR